MFPVADMHRCGCVMDVGIWRWCAVSRVCAIFLRPHGNESQFHDTWKGSVCSLRQRWQKKKNRGSSLLSFYLSTPVCKHVILLYCLYTKRHNSGRDTRSKMSSVGYTRDIESTAIFTFDTVQWVSAWKNATKPTARNSHSLPLTDV